jgi:hypothetical protein
MSIVNNLFIGNIGFFPIDITQGINEDFFINFGITESQILKIALHFGIIPAILLLIILIKLLKINSTNNLQRCKYSNENISMVKYMLSFFAISDIFYGTFLSSAMAIFFYSIIEFSYYKN